MAFQLPALEYGYDVLEPVIDTRTMEIHHTKHHQAYVDNLNKAVVGTPAENLDIEAICGSISSYAPVIRNNAGGHRNHSFFRTLLAPAGSAKCSAAFEQILTTAFGSIDEFKAQFAQAGMSRFGSGRAWLIKKDDGSLVISSTPNQDNPLMDVVDVRGTPILGLDVWEHAYYLNYQNRRADYIQARWEIVNWSKVEELYGS